MELDSSTLPPEPAEHPSAAARRLQVALTSAGTEHSRPWTHRLLRAPIRTILARAVTLAETRARWCVPARTRTFWGAKMRVRLPEPISNQLLDHGWFEPGLTALMLHVIRPRDTVLDVGAHYGYFTLLAGELVGPGGRVHAFEPTPSTFAVLRRNTRDRGNVITNQVAVWSHRTDVVVTDLGPRRSAFNTVFTPRLQQRDLRRGRSRQRTIPAVSLDDYCDEHTLRPAFVKVDAESAEYHILQGMKWVLNEPRPFVTLEVGDFDLPDVPRSSQLVEAMTSNGYVAFEHVDGRLRVHRPRQTYGYDNLLFGPAEHPTVQRLQQAGMGPPSSPPR